MKRFFLLLLAAFSFLAISACKDNNANGEDPEPVEPVDTIPNYLVMVYGTGGSTLDRSILSNIIQAIDEGGDEKVKITFEFKMSDSWQKNPDYVDFNGTRRFSYDDNSEFTGTFRDKTAEYPFLDSSALQYYLKNLKSEKIGDETYDISSPESLTDFIKWSKEKYPDAKRTLLILNSHGYGWKIAEDGNVASRSILPDDNLDKKVLTDKDVMNGINNAGGVDVLYTDACLMNMYENIYTYAKAVKYLLSAMETTPGMGGNYQKLISLLKNSNTDDESLEHTFCEYTDFCASKEWWGMEKGVYADLGFYNLSKLDNITNVLKKVSSTLTEKFTSEESIQATVTELPYGDSFAPYIRVAVTKCEMAQHHYAFTLYEMPDPLKPYMIADGLFGNPEDIQDEKKTYCDVPQLTYWLRVAPTDGAKEAFDLYPQQRDGLMFLLTLIMNCSYSITDMLRILDNELTDFGANNNPFKSLRAELLEAIKSMGHIACTTPKIRPEIDEAYELCSPGLVIIPLNSDTYYNDYNQALYVIDDYNQALKNYQSSYFDMEIGWSNFLQVLDVQPSPLTNKTRLDVDSE